MILRAAATAIAYGLLSACQPATQPMVTIGNAWSPATPPTATVAAVYMQVASRQSDVLLSAATPVAERAEMHTTQEDSGMMRMRPLESLDIPAGDSISFEPGGHHFMLVGLPAPLAAGSSFTMTLRFQNAGEIQVDVVVKAPGELHSHR